MDALEHAQEDLDTLAKLQRLIEPLDEDRQEAILEAYRDDLETYVTRYCAEDEIAQEGIGSLIKKGWDFIMGLIKQIYNFIKGFFGGSTGVPVTPKEVEKAVDKKEDNHKESQKKAKKATNEAKSKTQSDDRFTPFTLGTRDWTGQGSSGSAREALPDIEFLVRKMSDNLGSLSDQYTSGILHYLRDAENILTNYTSDDIDSMSADVDNILAAIESNSFSIDTLMLPRHNLRMANNNMLELVKVEDKPTEFRRNVKLKDENDFTSLAVSKNAFRDLLKTTGACISAVKKIMDKLNDHLDKFTKDPANAGTSPPYELSSALTRCAGLLKLLRNSSDVIDSATRIIDNLGPTMYERGLEYQHNPD